MMSQIEVYLRQGRILLVGISLVGYGVVSLMFGYPSRSLVLGGLVLLVALAGVTFGSLVRT